MYERIGTAAVVGLTLLALAGPATALDKLIGSVTAVDASAKTISVQETSASEPTLFSVDAKTKVYEGRKEVALSALQTGRGVKVTYEKRGTVPYVLPGRTTARFRDGKIAELVDAYDASVGPAAAKWIRESGLVVDPSYV